MSHVAWSLCLCVLGTQASCAKMAERWRCRLGADLCGSKEPFIRWESRSPTEGALLSGRMPAHCNVNVPTHECTAHSSRANVPAQCRRRDECIRHRQRWHDGHAAFCQITLGSCCFCCHCAHISSLEKQCQFDWQVAEWPTGCGVMSVSHVLLYPTDRLIEAAYICWFNLSLWTCVTCWIVSAVCRGLVRGRIGAWTRIFDPTCSRRYGVHLIIRSIRCRWCQVALTSMGNCLLFTLR